MTDVDPHLTVEIEGEKRELFASFGLVTELVKIVGSMEGALQLDVDPEASMTVLYALLAPRDKKGRVSDDDWVLPELTTEQADLMITWAGQHIFAYFIKGLQRGAQRLKANEETLRQLGSSVTSTSASPSLSASA